MRTVVLSIPDNDEAEDFARSILAAGGIKGYPFVPEGTTIDALIARPTLACHCKSRARQQRKMGKPLGDWTRAPRFGWFVHAACKKPAPIVVRDFISHMLCGCRNLLVELVPDGDKGKVAQPGTIYDKVAS